MAGRDAVGGVSDAAVVNDNVPAGAIAVPSAPSAPRSRWRRGRGRLWPQLVQLGAVVAVFLLWQLIANEFFSPILFPPPSEVLPAAWNELLDGSLIQQAAVSLGRIAVGFFIGSA